MKKCVLRILYLVLFLSLLCNFNIVNASFSYKIKTTSSVSASYSKVSITNNNKKTRTYYIYNQSKKDKYIKNHGCGTCCLTTILHAYGKCSHNGPDSIHSSFEKKILNKSNNNHPLGLAGMKKILNYYGISTTSSFTAGTNTCSSKLRNHLVNGKPAIILLKENSNYYCAKHVNGFHYILLLGYNANTKKVLVADSSSSYPRLHFEPINYIVTCMVKGKKNVTHPYYLNKNYGNGGYLLIN